MYDYHEDQSALIDLFRRCETTNQASALMSIGHAAASAGFHCEFTDYLLCMEQYSESYCVQLVEPTDGRIIFVFVFHLKRVHFGEDIMTLVFGRLLRVDPDYRRQHLVIDLALQKTRAVEHSIGFDFGQGYTQITNIPSLTLQRMLYNSQRKEIALLDIFILPTALNVVGIRLNKLSEAETERLWTVDLADWVCRPVLSDLRRIMKMKEYKGTFIVGDFSSG